MSKELSAKEIVSKLNSKQKKISRGITAPTVNEGYDGELTVRHILGQGIFLFYKWGGRWYSSRFSQYTRTTHERNEPVYLPRGRRPKVLGEMTLNKTNKVNIRKASSVNQIVSMNRLNTLDVSEIKTSRTSDTSMTTDNAGTADLNLVNTSGHVHLKLETESSTFDPFIIYAYRHGETNVLKQWVTGFDNSDTDTFKWNYKSSGTAPLAPSTTTASEIKMKLDTSGNLTLPHGTVTSGSTVLTGYGGLDDLSDVTYSSGDLTIASLDKIISGDLSFESSGKVIVDKNSTATNSSTNTAIQVDFDQTGIAASGQTLYGIGLDLDMNCEGVTHIGTLSQIGIDIDMVAATDGIQVQQGISIDVSGGDANQGLNIIVPDGASDYHIKLIADDDPVTDWATFAVADTGDLTIATGGDGTTDSDMTLDADGEIKLDAAATGAGEGVGMLAAGTRFVDFTVHHTASYFTMYENGGASTDDYVSLACQEHGNTILKTVDAAAAAAHLTVQIDGDIILEPASKDTYIYYDSSNYLKFDVDANGASKVSTVDDDGTAGHLTIQPNGDLILDPDSGNLVGKGSTLFLQEQADANADVTAYGQLWIHDDTPNTFMFTDDAGQDIIISKNTAVWGGYFPRMTGQNGKWLGIPTGQLGAAINFGTTQAAPDTSYTITSTADDMGAVIWQSIHGIRVTNCTIWYGQGGSTNTAHSVCLMRYDIDTNGDLTNGVEVGGVNNDLGSDDYTTLARTSLTMTSDVTVSSTQVLIAMVYCVTAINAAFTAKCILEYEDIP